MKYERYKDKKKTMKIKKTKEIRFKHLKIIKALIYIYILVEKKKQ